MSWISDVRADLAEMPKTEKAIKKFSLTVGIVFIFISLPGWYFGWNETIVWGIIIGSFLLISAGRLIPKNIIPLYFLWMGFAFAAGWIISRLILVILFYVVITPVGLIGRLFGKKFLDTEFRKGKSTNWILIPKKGEKNYEKMS